MKVPCAIEQNRMYEAYIFHVYFKTAEVYFKMGDCSSLKGLLCTRNTVCSITTLTQVRDSRVKKIRYSKSFLVRWQVSLSVTINLYQSQERTVILHNMASSCPDRSKLSILMDRMSWLLHQPYQPSKHKQLHYRC